MYKIGIISKPGRELTTIRAELSPCGFFQIDTFTDAPNAVSVLKARSLSSLVIILDTFSLKQLELVRKIRHFHPMLPMAFMARHMDFEAQKQALRIPGVIALSSQIDVSDLKGILVRMINGKSVQNRSDRRQLTMQTASIGLSEKDLLESGCLLDLASSGARLRTFKNEYVRGDKIKLKIPLAFMRKTYEVSAEVMWAKNEQISDTHPSKSRLLGLKFISVSG